MQILESTIRFYEDGRIEFFGNDADLCSRAYDNRIAEAEKRGKDRVVETLFSSIEKWTNEKI